MTTAEIMEYCERQITRMEQVVAFQRKQKWYEDSIRLRNLWLNACKADSLERIAKQLEDGQLSILEAENIAANIKLIADRLPD